jgi:hypothetical protein
MSSMERNTCMKRRSSRKLVDYTQHRRDDMPSMMSDDSIGKYDEQFFDPRNIPRRPLMLYDVSSSSISTNSVQDIEDDVPIDFLFKVPSFRRRSSKLSRAQLIQECEKRIENHDEDLDTPRARRVNHYETGRRRSLIARLLRNDPDEGKDDDDDDDASSTTVVAYHRRKSRHQKESKGARAA